MISNKNNQKMNKKLNNWKKIYKINYNNSKNFLNYKLNSFRIKIIV